MILGVTPEGKVYWERSQFAEAPVGEKEYGWATSRKYLSLGEIDYLLAELPKVRELAREAEEKKKAEEISSLERRLKELRGA